MTIPRIFPGEKLRGLPAASWNQFAAAAEFVAQLRRAGLDDNIGAQSLDTSETVVLVRNETGFALDAYGVVALGPALVTPEENLVEFTRRRAFRGVLPLEEYRGRFGIMRYPLSYQSSHGVDEQYIGHAVVMGVTQVQVRVLSDSHRFADISPGAVEYLDSAVAGGAEILWREDATAEQVVWAYVRLGGGSGAAATGTFAMIASKTGTAPPFRYTAVAATMDASGAWSAGGTEYDPVYNIEEQGSGGEYVNPLLPGDVAVLYPAPGGASAWVAQRQRYRGTY